jgi:CRP-like cAMP-binding protein
LRSGELFGEMALLGDNPTNAEVRTVVATSILFLGRDYFRRLVSALPALRKYFEDLSRSRGKGKV